MDFLARSASCPATSYGVAFGRIMKSLARSALCALITVPIRLGSHSEKALILRNQGFFVYICLYSRKNKSEKPHVFETHVASQRYMGPGIYCADASAEAVVASADAEPSAEALGLSDGTGEAEAVPGARRTIRQVPSW